MKIMAAAGGGGDRLSDLPEPIILHILSMLPDNKQVVQTSVLSSQWRFRWKAVPMSLNFYFRKNDKADKKKNLFAYVASVNRNLHYWRSCEKIKSFTLFPYSYKDDIDLDVDFWLHFATHIGKVEEFTLKFYIRRCPGAGYEFPEFAYKNTVLRKLVLGSCTLDPSGIVNWSNLVSLSIGDTALTEGVLKKVLSGCPNLECLGLHRFLGIRRLEISSVKLRKLILRIHDEECDGSDFYCLEIHAPYIRHLELRGLCCYTMHYQLRNVASLVTAVLALGVDFCDLVDKSEKLEKECRYLQELLHNVAHVENLELGPWCIECLSVLDLKGWPVPSSSCWKFLKLNAALGLLDYPGIFSFLLNSSDLETLVIDWRNRKPRALLSKYTNLEERWMRFKTHCFNCSLPHLKTIKFINFYGTLSESKFIIPLVKCFQKNATALKKFVIAKDSEGSDVSWNYVVRSS